MRDVTRLSAFEAAQEIADGRLTSETLVRALLERIEERDDAVSAWAYLDPELALAEARKRDGERARGDWAGLWCIPCGYVEWHEDIREEAEGYSLQGRTGGRFVHRLHQTDPQGWRAGRWARRLQSWIDRATRLMPEPGSPQIKVGASLSAACRTRFRNCWAAGLVPTKSRKMRP
jgi:hypothetical protein